MTEVVEQEFLQELAVLVAQWIPDLRGRSVAVTDSEITKENRPSLPFAQLALNREDVEHDSKGNRNPIISDDFIIELWLPLVKYRSAETQAETPWWAYYPYERIRDKLVSRILTESKNRQNWGIRYISMDVSSDAGAVILTFRFSRNYTWCPDDIEDDEAPISLTTSICVDVSHPSAA